MTTNEPKGRTDMTDLNLNELRKVAEAATPGPWVAVELAVGKCFWVERLDDEADVANEIPSRPTAIHIAAFDPPTVLALLDRVAELEAKVARVESLAETATRWRDHWQDGIPRPEPLHAVEELVLELAALEGESDE